MGSIHDAIGGQRDIDAAVHRFRHRVAADPDLACHFTGMDLRRIMAHEIALLRLFFTDRTIREGEV
jgi:truncated hemoglobin YjbI